MAEWLAQTRPKSGRLRPKSRQAGANSAKMRPDSSPRISTTSAQSNSPQLWPSLGRVRVNSGELASTLAECGHGPAQLGPNLAPSQPKSNGLGPLFATTWPGFDKLGATSGNFNPVLGSQPPAPKLVFVSSATQRRRNGVDRNLLRGCTERLGKHNQHPQRRAGVAEAT